MLPSPASRAGGRPRPASWFVLRGLLAAAVVLGMLAMHSIPSNAEAMHDGGTHQSAPPGLGAAPAATLSQPEPQPAGIACASCPPDHFMAAGCVASTHLTFSSCFPPAMLAGGHGLPSRAGPGLSATAVILSRAPSLHFLCISRS